MRDKNLVKLIKELIRCVGSESADNILAGMLILKPDYFTLKKMLEEFMFLGKD